MSATHCHLWCREYAALKRHAEELANEDEGLREFARLVRDTAARPHLVAAARAIVGDDES